MSLPRLRFGSTEHLAPRLALAAFLIAVPAASGVVEAAGEQPVAARSRAAETVRGRLRSTAGDGQVELPAGGRLLDHSGGAESGRSDPGR